MLNEIKITQANDNEGYVFVSYSSKNRDTVLNNYLIPLQRDYGLRIYYDEAFEDDATRTWTDQMQENLQKAQVCLMFASSYPADVRTTSIFSSWNFSAEISAICARNSPMALSL